MIASLGSLAAPVERRLEELREDRVVERIWARDTSLWPGDAEEIGDRLGWLTVPGAMEPETANLRSFADEVSGDGIQTTVVLGMGGSSLAPAVLGHGAPRAMLVLDSTHPRAIRNVREQLDIARTLFVVSSKSGTTLETVSLFAYFWEETSQNGQQFVAITDEGSYLDGLAQERGFRRVFRNPSDIGGRFSALSYFGLVPAALAGVDAGQLVSSAQGMFAECRSPNVETNPGVLLGAVLGEAAANGRDKLTVRVGDELSGFGGWAEQLIAESTGKGGNGIVPVVDGGLVRTTAPLPDQLFVDIGCDGPVQEPGLSLHAGAADLGAEFARWEFATAVAGHILGLQPYDQPDVQSAKDATASALASPGRRPAGHTVADALETLASGSYLSLLAYLPDEPETTGRLEALRSQLAVRHGVVTTLGYGPRYLHSTGQLHKGGPEGGAYLVIEDETLGVDVDIPGRPYSFGQLIAAQAEGDVASLMARGRVVARTTLEQLQESVNA